MTECPPDRYRLVILQAIKWSQTMVFLVSALIMLLALIDMGLVHKWQYGWDAVIATVVFMGVSAAIRSLSVRAIERVRSRKDCELSIRF